MEIEDLDPVTVSAINEYFPKLIELKTILSNLMFVLIKLDFYDKAIEEGLRAKEIDPNI